MTESTARAERYDLQSSTSPYYTWEVPQKSVSVRIPYGLMDRLEKEAVDNFRSLSSRGSEIGGLLLGTVSPGSPMTVSLTDYELINCDYSRGPLYRLSDADMARFERAIQQRLAGGQGIAGFFRSQTRKGMSLDGDDLTFFEQRFRDPHQLILLVRPYATKASTAAIFVREGGKINGDSSLLEFPFRSSELGPAKSGSDPAEAAPKPAAPPPAPAAPKPAARAQIVPIASRREAALPSETATAAPAVPEAPVVQPVASAPPAPPAPAKSAAPVAPAKAAPPAAPTKPAPPASPAKTAPVPVAAPVQEDKASKTDKQAKNEKPAGKNEKAPAQAVAQTATPAPAGKAVDADKPAPAPKDATPVVAPEEAPRSNKMVKLLLAAAASIALFVVLFVYPGFVGKSSKPATTAAVDTSPLQLRVERTAGELLLTWNRDSDAIRTATKAVLTINDGDQHENVEMDLAQLRNGSIVYSPSGADISFKMEVSGKNQSKVASESVRVLRTRPSPMDQTPAATSSQAPAKPVNGVVPGTQPGTQPATQPGKPGANGTAVPGTPDTPAVEEAKPTPQAPSPTKPFSTASLSQRLRPVAQSDIPDAPSLAGVGAAPTAIPGVNFGAGVQAPAAPQAPAPPKPAAPTAAPPTQTTTSGASGSSKSGGQIQQATLVYKKDPEYPKIAKQTGAKGQVKLVATIGKDGRVKSVKVLSGHPMLQNAAMDAVRQWVYKPTLLNGAAVETETEIVVNFLGDR